MLFRPRPEKHENRGDGEENGDGHFWACQEPVGPAVRSLRGPRPVVPSPSPMRTELFHLTDDELFADVLRLRAEAREAPDARGRGPAADEIDRLLGELCERWRRPAGYVIR